MRRRGAGVVVAACIAVLVTGCAGAQSTMSITYDDDGDERTMTAAFDDIKCSDTEARGVEVDPVYAAVNVYFDDPVANDRGSARVYDGILVVFRADAVTVTRDGDKLSVYGEGTVQLVERVPDEEEPVLGEAFDIENARESAGVLEAELTCAN